MRASFHIFSNSSCTIIQSFDAVALNYRQTVKNCKVHGVTCQKAIIINFTAIRTSYLIFLLMIVLAEASEEERSLRARVRQAVSPVISRKNKLTTMRS
jgi:hypothetical protein